MFRKIIHLISRIPYSKSITQGIKLVQGDPDYLIDRVICQIKKDLKNKKYEFSVKVVCLDPHRTGFGTDQLVSLYGEGGFNSFDIAFGELTSQVIRASERFDSGFYFMDVGNKCLLFDRDSKRWIDYPSVTHKCSKCGNQVEYSGCNALDMDGLIGLCRICDGYMR